MITIEHVPCNLCGNDDARTLFLGPDRAFGKPGVFPVVQCRQCGLIYVNPRPVADALVQYHPREVFPAYQALYAVKKVREGAVLRIRDLVKRATAELHLGYSGICPELPSSGLGRTLWRLTTRPLVNRVSFFMVPYQADGQLLDVGCGSGWFLDLLARFGWQTYGLEVEPDVAERVRAKGHRIFCGQLWEAGYPAEMFDVVWIRHVLEHLTDPLRGLREIWRILKRGGRAYIEVPNTDSLVRHLFGRYWTHWDLPRHTYHFPRRTLRAMARRAGFQVQREIVYQTPYTLVNSARYLGAAIRGITTCGLRWPRASERMLLWPVCALLNATGWGDLQRLEVVKP